MFNYKHINHNVLHPTVYLRILATTIKQTKTEGFSFAARATIRFEIAFTIPLLCGIMIAVFGPVCFIVEEGMTGIREDTCT